MLDIKFIRSNPDEVVAAMKKRGMDLDLSEFLALDENRRKVLSEVEQLKSKRNSVSKEIGIMKKNGENADDLVKEMGEVGEKIKELDKDNKIKDINVYTKDDDIYIIFDDVFKVKDNKLYSVKFCIAINLIFAYNVSRFNNNVFEKYSDKRFK